ncbi:hypothetical protein BT63DRAFT_416639 [Microthyrium microscopicum]|uniref:Uncharacterized protein n=1 Tax=Microthyrium microscopicum TaxID=703497 RepID=A0A6A6U2U4_9PEZI|nr:hypothetical protein BT63DRAFT_416639 [Microthyrium microscopicum]
MLQPRIFPTLSGMLTPPRSPIVTTMNSPPSIGDVLNLSQCAWRTGRAFNSGSRSGQANLPTTFLEIEEELNRLAKALKRFAEFLVHENIESLISGADPAAQDGLGVILTSCKRTLEDLSTLVDTHQATRRNTVTGGYTIERIWNPAFLANHHALVWTVNGGSIYDLYEMLRMHSVTITMLRVVLESHSTTGVEMGIIPIAEKINELYLDMPQDDLSSALAEIRGLAHASGGDIPSPASTVPPTPTMGGFDLRRVSTLLITPAMSPDIKPSESESGSNVTTPVPLTPLRVSSGFFSVPPSGDLPYHPARKSTTSLPTPSAPVSPRSELPSLSLIPTVPLTPGSLDSQPQGLQASASASDVSALSQSISSSGRSSLHRHSHSADSLHLPPPVWDDETKSMHKTERLSLLPQLSEEPLKLGRSASTISQQQEFERTLFRNAAILCDVRGTLVEYTVPAAADQPFEVDLEKAMADCRVCLVRHKRTTRDGRINYSTSIWSFSDDRSVRLEQKLDEREEIIPYTSYFQPEKASITIPTKLIYHGNSRTTPPTKIAQTTWLNYYFADEAGCREFQNQIFGRALIASYKVEKILRVHEGLAGIVASQEQMCGMENLRVWDEDETGGIMALIHFSALFRTGYMKVYLNNAKYPIMLKDEGGRVLRIKGLRVPVDGGHGHHHHHHHGHFHAHKKEREPGSKKSVNAKVEFLHEADKLEFMALVREAQKGMVDIDDE